MIIYNTLPGNAKARYIDKGNLISHSYNGSCCGPAGDSGKGIICQKHRHGPNRYILAWIIHPPKGPSSVRLILLTGTDGCTVRE